MKIIKLSVLCCVFLLSALAPRAAQAQWDYNYLTPNYNNFTYYRGYGKTKRSRSTVRTTRRHSTRITKRGQGRKLYKTSRRGATQRRAR